MTTTQFLFIMCALVFGCAQRESHPVGKLLLQITAALFFGAAVVFAIKPLI